MLTSILEQSLPAVIVCVSNMVAVRLLVRDVPLPQQQAQDNDSNAPQHQYQPQQLNPWVQDGANGSIIINCCQGDSPYHKLICGHLIYSQSKGCGRTCRAAVNKNENLRTEFCCDWCSDEQTFDGTIKEIYECWADMILENRILLLVHLQPYIDDFEYRLTLGRRARIGRRGQKAFARPDRVLVDRFQIQIEELIERSCHYFLKLIIDRKGSDLYDEPVDDGDGDGQPGEELSDEVEEGKIENSDTKEDEEEAANVPNLTKVLSLRPHPQSSTAAQHRLSAFEDLLGSVDFGDSFGSVEEVVRQKKSEWQHKYKYRFRRRGH
jgi:hypothetical protein